MRNRFMLLLCFFVICILIVSVVVGVGTSMLPDQTTSSQTAQYISQNNTPEQNTPSPLGATLIVLFIIFCVNFVRGKLSARNDINNRRPK